MTKKPRPPSLTSSKYEYDQAVVAVDGHRHWCAQKTSGRRCTKPLGDCGWGSCAEGQALVDRRDQLQDVYLTIVIKKRAERDRKQAAIEAKWKAREEGLKKYADPIIEHGKRSLAATEGLRKP